MGSAQKLIGAATLVMVFIGAAVFMLPVSGAEPAESCTPEYVAHLGPSCLLPNGHYLVFLEDGTTLTTHGPDPVPPDGEVGFGPKADQRPPVCATEWHMHVLYGHPPSAPSRLENVTADLRAAIRRTNALLNADALESGVVNADYRVACTETGEIRIDGFAGPETGGNVYTTDFSAVVSAAQAAGFKSPQADYAIFYDDSSEGVCGVGNLVSDDRLAADNGNLKGPHYGVTYKGCWFGRTPMHENGHNQGAVQRLAPMWDATGHCLEGTDVMCYPTSSILLLCRDRVHYDCNFDTYFDARPEAGEWLSNHWNIGSRLNSYLSFMEPHEPAPTTSASSSPSPSPSASPTPSPSASPSATTSSSPSPASSPPASPSPSPSNNPTPATQAEPSPSSASAALKPSPTTAGAVQARFQPQEPAYVPNPGAAGLLALGAAAAFLVKIRRP